MTNKAEDDNEEVIKIGPGDFLAFGSINLVFTLNLTKHDLSKYKLNWEDLETLDNLRFIRKHKHFWKRIELSSDDNTMNILLNINKTSQKLIKIGYVGLKKMVFQDNQIDFQDFIIKIAKQNGLYITSFNVCKCTICVQLLLKYENEEKKFLLCGKPKDIDEPKNNENDENENKENKENKNFEDNKDKKNYEEDKNNEKEEKKEESENKENLKKKEYEEDKKKEEHLNTEEYISKIDEDNEVNNPFVNIVDNNINAGDFHFIYFNFNDYKNGEFKGKIRLEHLFEYFQDIKIRTKAKIILNFEEEAEVFKNQNKDEIFKDLLSITDVFIFYNKNKLYDVLKELKEEEDKEFIDTLYKLHYFESQRKLIEKEKMKKREEEWAQNYKNLIEKYRTNKENKIPKHLRTYENNNSNNNQNIYITQDTMSNENEINKNNQILKTNDNHETESKNESTTPNIYQISTESQNNNNNNFRDIINTKQNLNSRKNNLQPIKPSPPKPLSKNDMFNYFKGGIFSRDPQKRPFDKIILVLDEFNKIFIVKCNKFEEKPFVLDFDLKLYPQMNVRNMNDILEYKKFIKSKFPEYVNIFMGSLLGVIAGKGKNDCDDDSLFLGYLVGTNIVKKIAEIQRFNLPLPKNKEFFYPSINKNELEKILIEANKRKKEKYFILDGNNKSNMVMKPYNPLLDKNLHSFLNSKNNRIFLKSKGFIGKNGKIMYDPIYRETLGFHKQPSFQNNYNCIQNIKLQKIKNEKKFKSHEKKPTDKILVGYRLKSPGYEVYKERQKKKIIILPPINDKKQYSNVQNKKKEVIDEKSDEDASNMGSGTDSGSGQGSGSGNGDE